MNYFQFLGQDWHANRGNPKGRLFLFLFRVANYATRKRWYFYVSLPYQLFYKVFVQWLFVIEIPWSVRIGRDFSVYHCLGTVLNNKVVIGRGCTLRQCTTIGVKNDKAGRAGAPPIIGDHVDIGSNVCIIGAITIGNGARIGSGSVIVKSVPEEAIAYGNPAVIKIAELV